MTTAASDPIVTIVSSDRELLCDLSWTLSLFGYDVSASLDYTDECPSRRHSESGILLIDTRGRDDAAELLASSASTSYTYHLAIELPASTEQRLLEGADDVVRYPVNKGELLTRLRAGVRRLEFEQRLSQRSRRDSATGLLTRQALVRLLKSSHADLHPTSCVVFGIDWLKQVQQQFGTHAVRHLNATLARCLGRALEPGEVAGLVGDNALIALLQRPAEVAFKFAEAVNRSFAASDTLVREIRSVSSVSAVVAPWDAAIDIDEQLDRLGTTLEQTHYFGGDYIAAASDVQQNVTSWRTDLDDGVPFQDVVAQDLMELFPAIVTREQAETGYLSALPTTQLQVPCLPVVDDNGRLCGSLEFATHAAGRGNEAHTIEYNQPLSDLFEAFNTTESDYLVVVDDQQSPLGYLTCEGLASLVLDRMSADRYRLGESAPTGAASLIVPVVPVDHSLQEALAT